MTAPIIDRLALIGVGLIGGSIARAAREYGAVRSIVATARSEATRRRVVELGIADQVVETNAEAAKDADLVIVCIPVGASGPVAAEIAASLKPGAIVSDVGSVKSAVLKDMAPHIPKGVHLIPAHPVAGTENSGPDSGFPELFVNRWCILTPPEGADADAVEKLRAFWTALGANVEIMTAEHHDMVLAITSHLPHLIAYTIVGTAEEFSTVSRSEVLKFSAGGFRDFTRIAASDPTMWRDVFLHNKEAVLEMLAQFNEDLVEAHPRDAARRRRYAVRSLHPHARDPPRHRADRPGFGRARLRPHASGQARGADRAALCGGQRVGTTSSVERARRRMRRRRACSETDAALPPGCNVSSSLPEIPQHLPRRIVPRQPGHAAARMRAGAAHVEPRERPAIIRMAEHRARREHLPEIERAVEDVAADEAEGALEIERREDLPPEHRALEVRRVAVDRRRSSGRRPSRDASSHDEPSGSSGATCWQNRLATCCPGGASVSSSVDEITISTIGSRDQPCVRASK